jgi:hypothetical protein
VAASSIKTLLSCSRWFADACAVLAGKPHEQLLVLECHRIAAARRDARGELSLSFRCELERNGPFYNIDLSYVRAIHKGTQQQQQQANNNSNKHSRATSRQLLKRVFKDWLYTSVLLFHALQIYSLSACTLAATEHPMYTRQISWDFSHTAIMHLMYV